MPDPVARLKTTVEGEVRIVELVDRKILDEAVISQISQQLFPLVGQAAPRMVLDFINVGHMSSSALGMLITLLKRIREKGGKLILCNIRPSIYEVFAITRLNEVFTISPTRREALGEATN